MTVMVPARFPCVVSRRFRFVSFHVGQGRCTMRPLRHPGAAEPLHESHPAQAPVHPGPVWPLRVGAGHNHRQPVGTGGLLEDTRHTERAERLRFSGLRERHSSLQRGLQDPVAKRGQQAAPVAASGADRVDSVPRESVWFREKRHRRRQRRAHDQLAVPGAH